MADRTKMETGQIQRLSADTIKDSKLEYQTKRKREDTLGANIGDALGDSANDEAIRRAISSSSSSRRDEREEKLPTDSLDLEQPGPAPKQKH